MNEVAMQLVIVSHVPHYEWEGRLYAFGPYAREIDIWADLFPKIRIAAPFYRAKPPSDCQPFNRFNISIAPQREVGGNTLGAKLSLMLSVPGMMVDLCNAMRGADAIHVRCPGNLGLLGAVLAPLFSRRLIAKYAGQWNGYPGEEWTVRLQRAILRSSWWRGPVTVYGHWPDQPPNVVPFFTSILTDEQIERGRRAAASRQRSRRLRVLFLGRVTEARNVDVILSAVARLHKRGLPIEARIVGDGPMRPALEEQARRDGIESLVEFTGALEYDRVLETLEQADVLVLASQTEGWGKALVEGMAYGLVCVGSDRGPVPMMMSEGRGFVVPPRDVDALAEILVRVANDPTESAAMGRRAMEWAAGYSLESLREALRQVMLERWGVPAQSFPTFARSGALLRKNVPTES
jgi:glycosyltransferase involved in cell wall biosynthesis